MTPPASLESDFLYMLRNTVQTDVQSSCSYSGYDDTSLHLGERLVVHVENQSANRWKDCVQCCGSHSGRHVAGHVPRFLSVLDLCVCVGVFFANSSAKLNIPQPGGQLTTCSSSLQA